MKRTLVLLTLNEINGCRVIVPKIPQETLFEFFAIDGGSTDGTIEFLKERGVRVIQQNRRGRGAAFQIAVEESKGDQLVYFSPDGNEDPSDIPKLFDLLDQSAEMAIASRFLPQSRNEEDDDKVPARKWVNQLFTFVANALWNQGPYVTDTINGFRGITKSAFLKIHPRSDRFTIEYELSIQAMKHRMLIKEIPTIEGNRIGGVTKVASFKTGLSFLKFLCQELLRKP